MYIDEKLIRAIDINYVNFETVIFLTLLWELDISL